MYALPPSLLADDAAPWVGQMKQVHARFTGTTSTLALFGDSITVSLAFWAPLRAEPKGMPNEMASAHALVRKHMKPECWDKWRGPKYGNNGSMTIRWAHDNIDKWLKEHNPEVAVIMFGTNDLGQLGVKEYEQKTSEVVDRCLKNGTVAILTTPPPRSGLLPKSKDFAEAVRRVAKDKAVPLIDYHAEILKRRPQDWDGALPQFRDVKGSEYEVPTLIARDGVHPSNPRTHRDYSEESLRCNGYALRNYLTLLEYGRVISHVLRAKSDSTQPCTDNGGLIDSTASGPTAEEVLSGLRAFYRKTARPDGSFQPGIDPAYRGMSDCAASDLAAVTYAVTIHKTFGWELPHEAKTAEFLLSRQKEGGAFFNVAGTLNPDSPDGRTYNTTQGLVALHALGVKPRFNPLPVFEAILKEDYKALPPYSTSFFPLAYLCAGKPIPEQADGGIRALMVQDETGYLNDHIAATFHASHYYRLIGEETPKAPEMVARILRDQKPDGSWLLNMPSRDRHATFDAVFTLVHEGEDRLDCRAAIQRAAGWVLSCRNEDGGFGHFPGSTSDADAVYFHIGTLVMAGFLKPVNPLPKDPHLLSWGHLTPVKPCHNGARLALRLPSWVASIAFSQDGRRLATGSADRVARVFDGQTGRALVAFQGHDDTVTSVCFHPEGKWLATGSYDKTAAIWDAESGKLEYRLVGHRGAVMSVAFGPDKTTLATGSIDSTIRLWDVSTGRLKAVLRGHKSWVNSVAFGANSGRLVSGSSDGTVRVWSSESSKPLQALHATSAEVRSVAISCDGTQVAAGFRYGTIKVWETSNSKERLSFQGHQGDICPIAFSSDGKLIAAGEGDWNRGGLVKVWDVAGGKTIASFQHTGEVLSVAFSPDGKSVAAGGADNTVKIWSISPGSE
jgi:geranylgeranyl transferase type-2 subunit beta